MYIVLVLTLWRNTVYSTIAELTVEGLQTRAGLPATAKHIKVRYFWLKDLIDEKEIVLLYTSPRRNS